MKTFKEYLITQNINSDFDKIKALYLNNVQLTDLYGIEEFTNLKSLFCGWNYIKDITPLKNLKNLRVVNLSGNSVTDISTICYLPKLEILDITWFHSETMKREYVIRDLPFIQSYYKTVMRKIKIKSLLNI